MKTSEKYNFLFAGGGTGGHFYPAVAVAQQIKIAKPDAKICFVGLKDKIEGQKSKDYGFEFYHVYIYGLGRKLNNVKNIFKNLLLPFVLFFALLKCMFLLLRIKPNVVIGVGGYSSFMPVICGGILGKKIILLEQNSFPGLATRLLEKIADKIYLNFENAKEFLKCKEKIETVGNPIRVNLSYYDKASAAEKFNLKPTKKTILLLGGSLGAKTLNEAIEHNIQNFNINDFQLIWQTGKKYFSDYAKYQSELIKVYDFIDDMAAAYNLADLIIARAGASTLAEIIYYEKPAIVIPSPNVTDNHQYYNALYLENNQACVMIADNEVKEKLFYVVKEILSNDLKVISLKNGLKKFKEKYSKASEIIAAKAIEFAELK